MTKKRSIKELRASALALLGEGKASEARTVYERICGHENCSADDWFRLGIISGQLGLFDESVTGCKNAVLMNPGHSAAYYGLGMALHAKGELEDAVHNLLAAIRLDPGNKDASMRYRVVMRELNQDKKLEVRIYGGISICVPATLDCLTTYVLLEQEDWFENEIKFVRVLMKSGECALDVGANYGTYTNVMASTIGERGCVVAFEPATETAQFLAESIRKNGFKNVMLKQLALSNYSGRARLQTGILSECNTLLQCGGGSDSEDVKVTTLDDVVKGLDCESISFVKIDVEGGEENIIQGGNAFFANYSPLLMLEIKHGDKVNLHLIELLRVVGYNPYRLVPGMGVLVPFCKESGADSFQLNLFFCKRDKMKELVERGLLIMSSTQEEADDSVAVCGGEFFELMRNFHCFTVIHGQWASGFSRKIPGGLQYLDGLNQYALSCSVLHAREVRYRSLVIADRKISAAYNTYSTPSRALSLVRIKTELGYQSSVATILKSLVEQIDALDIHSIQEPFIPASSRYEIMDPGEDILEWFKSSILEHWELLRSFTSFSQGVVVLDILEKLKNIGFSGPEIERRYQLKRLQNGLQEKPVFNGNLLDNNGEYLNPGFWNIQI